MLNTELHPLSLLGLVATIFVIVMVIWRFIVTRFALRESLALLRQENAVFAERLKSLDALQQDNQDLQKRLDLMKENVSSLEKDKLELELSLNQERENHQEKLQVLHEAEGQFRDAFKSLSSEILKSNNTAFLELANEKFEHLRVSANGDLQKREDAISGLVNPIKEGLKQFDSRMEEMEKGRAAQMSSVTDLIQNLAEANQQTRIETHHLVSALKSPNVRGQWGEMQLRRTIELAGMVKYCDFVEQKKIGGDEVNLRPDVVIRLPNSREIVIDSKVPLRAYLEGNETDDLSERELKMDQHARHIRDHLKQLGKKAYHEYLKESPEFVVLFLPGEAFYSTALERDPSLIEYGVDRKVLIATPTTLIALLKAIAYGWKNQEMVEKADDISQAGRDLYESMVKVLEHFANVRRSLNQTVNAFNQTIRSTDKRLLPRIRKFNDLGAGSEREIPEIRSIEAVLERIDDSDFDQGERAREG